MKKILFVTNKLTTGGMEIALYETVKVLKQQDFDITVATMLSGGNLVESFKEICTVKDLSKDYNKAFITSKTVINNFKKVQLISLIKNLFLLLKQRFASYYKFKELISKRMPRDDQHYDFAVAYATPYTSYVPYILNNITADKKLGWVELDVSSYLKEVDVSGFEECYARLDNVICDSEHSRLSFITRHPSLSEKTLAVYNPIDTERIFNASQENSDIIFEDETVLCTVGRLSYDKGFDIAVGAHKILKDKGYRFKWLVCGEGDYRSALEENIKESGLENDFILLGNQKNPYKYINAADIYVQTSRTESYCLTLAEARVLKKPIVTTNIPTATEHVTNGYNGYICDMNAESVANAIEQLINSPELRQKFSENTTPIDCDNSALKKLFE